MKTTNKFCLNLFFGNLLLLLIAILKYLFRYKISYVNSMKNIICKNEKNVSCLRQNFISIDNRSTEFVKFLSELKQYCKKLIKIL